MITFLPITAKVWEAREKGKLVGTITEIEHGYDTKHADGFRWTYETLDAAQESFLEQD